MREWLYRVGFRKIERLPVFTISVGNLSLGGTGKSPLVQALVRLYLQNNQTPLVLTRGYGRESRDVVYVPPRQSTEARAVGDEAFLLKNLFPECALLVHSDRVKHAKQRLQGITLAILDDAFQHWRGFRHCDIVLWDMTQDLGEALLPFGRMRETPQALERADLIVCTRVDELANGELAFKLDGLQRHLRSLRPRSQWPWKDVRAEKAWPPKVFLATHQAQLWRHSSSEQEFSPKEIAGKKVILVSGIARPQSFRHSVQSHGAEILDEFCFPDHHVFGLRDKQRILSAWEQHGQPIILCTEKDFCRASALTEIEHLHVWRVGLNFVGGTEGFFAAIEEQRRWAGF